MRSWILKRPEILLTLFYVVIFCTNIRSEPLDPIVIHSGGEVGVVISSVNGCQVLVPELRLHPLSKTKYQWYEVSDSLMNEIMRICGDYEKELISPSKLVWSLREHTRFIYPGTKYCGSGNSSSGADDLGEHAETDKCCREHDSCQDYVPGFSCHPKNGLCNHTPFTRSSCACDDNFRQCLLATNETASTKIGKLFFNVFGLKCYRMDYPITECVEYGGFLNIHCQKYALDYSKPKLLQFFDSPEYIPLIPIEERQ
ncbi:unnamed protein product [Allacma fusca]|uniref:phospholipase A2 n=1 Tax=Allacma fusca TaxID=39272 RepID=A0A8J2PTQ5_9HEXA|nr:unnamed protein product [Allacma fusca]